MLAALLLPIPLAIAAPEGGVRCELDLRPAGALTEIAAIAHGPPGTEGSYRLSVRMTGGGNSSVSSQGGAFRIAEDGQVTLARTVMGGSGQPEAQLRLQVGDRSVDCDGAG